MTVQFEKIEENKVKLTVTVEAETFNKALDFAFKKVSKDVEIKGFRKGKVPRVIFEQRFGEGALYEDAINYVVSSAYPNAIDEAKIEPVAQPEIDFDYESIGKNKDFTFYATVVVKPEVTLGDYKGLEVTELSAEVTEADIEAEVNKLLDRHAELIVKEEAAENGDTVVIDYEGFKDGQPFEGGGGTNYSLTLGSNSFIPGFEEQLVGIKAGEDREINVTFPEVYHSDELAGAEAVFKVHCHEIKTRQLPELTDDFVKELELENIETVAALKEDAKTKLATQKETNAKNAVIDSVVDQAAENATITIPEEMVKAEAERMIQDTEQRLSQQGLTLDLYLQYTGGTREGLLDQFSGDALKRIRYNLTLEAIAIAEGIEATTEEVQQQMEDMAKAYNVTVEQVKMAFPNTADLENEIKVRKAVDFLVEQAIKKPAQE
jgi:trigger factor